MSNIKTIKDALAILENVESAKESLVAIQAEHDLLRNANVELQQAQAQAELITEQNRMALAEAKVEATEIVAKARVKAAALEKQAEDQFTAQLAEMEGRIDKECEDERQELEALNAAVVSAKAGLEDLHTQINELEGKKAALESAIDTLKKAAGL